MQVFNHGEPCFDELETWEKSLLLDPLVEVIKDFYANEKNRQAYEQWLADGKPMEQSGTRFSQSEVLMLEKSIKQEVHYSETKFQYVVAEQRHEQTKMSI